MKICFSVNNVPIRLSKERFEHISSRHPEMKKSLSDILETIQNPDFVQQGDAGVFLALKKFTKTPVSDQKYLVVVYREIDAVEGFILTAYYTNKPRNRVIV